MKLKGKFLQLALCAALGASFGQANAALMKVVYTDRTGVQQTLISPSQIVKGSEGNMQFTVSAGLDRKVSVSIYDMSDKLISAATSRIIRVEDKVTGEDGTRTYGMTVSLNTPPNGKYKLVTRTLGYQDIPVQEDTIELVVDSIAPKIAGQLITRGTGGYAQIGQGTYENLNIFSGQFASLLYLDQVTDDIGITDAKLNVYYAEGAKKGQLVKSVQAEYNPITQSVSYGQGIGTWRHLLPEDFIDYTFEFVVSDLAGNQAVYRKNAGFAASCPPVQGTPVAMYDPAITTNFLGQAAFKGYKAWKNGDPINQNPSTVLWAFPNEWVYPQNKYGYVITPEYKTSTTSYIKGKAPIAFNNEIIDRNIGGHSSTTGWICNPYTNITGTLTSGTLKTPKSLGIETRVGNEPWGSAKYISSPGFGNPGLNRVFLNRPLPITGIRTKVEPRNYVQVVRAYSDATLTCKVPINGTYCDIALNKVFPHRTYTAYAMMVTAETKPDILHHAGYSLIITDYEGVNIDQLNYDFSQKNGEILLVDNDADEGELSWNNYWWKPALAELKFTSLNPSVADKTLNFKWTDFVRRNRSDYSLPFSIENFPEGEYTLDSIKITDSAYNESVKQLNPSFYKGSGKYVYIVDKTKPTIHAVYTSNNSSTIITGEDTFPKLNSLDQLSFQVKDKSEFIVDYISVTFQRKAKEGEEEFLYETVNVGHRKVGDNIHLEYPILFPKAEELEN